MEIVWDFSRQIAAAGSPAGLLHYFDNEAQATYLNGGDLQTRLSVVDTGQWGDYDTAFEIVDRTEALAALRWDHPNFGVVYGGAADPDALWFIWYRYAADISALIQSGRITLQTDNQINSLALDVMNTSGAQAGDDDGLFVPGNKLSVEMYIGSWDEAYDFGEYFIDSAPYSALAKTNALSARSVLGPFGYDVAFDPVVSYSGRRDEVVLAIIEDGLDGVISSENILVQTDATSVSLNFKRSDGRLETLTKYLDTLGWRIRQLTDGRILAGDVDFIKGYIRTTYYSFQLGRDVRLRQITRAADGAYSRVLVYNQDWSIVKTAAVTTQPGWKVPSKKTFFQEAPKGASSADCEALAALLALQLTLVGVAESLEGPMRPWLNVGDVAQVLVEGSTYAKTGTITQLVHSFGASGYRTEIDTDSGGTAVDDGDGLGVTTTIAALRGQNRRPGLTDIIRQQVKDATVKQSEAANAGLSAHTGQKATASDGAHDLRVSGGVIEYWDSASWVPATAGSAENGLPTGGTDGQTLLKVGSENYDSAWGDLPVDVWEGL